MTTQYTQEQLDHFISHPEEVDATDSDLVEALASRELADLGVTEEDQVKTKGDDANADEEDAKRAIEEAKAKTATEEQAQAAAKAKADAEAKAKSDAEAAAAKAAAAKGAKGDEEVTEDSRVLTADGRNTMPFSVVKEARERARGAEEALAEANQSLVAMSEQLKAARAGKDLEADATGKTEDELDAMVESVSGEAPWIREAMTKIVGAVREARSEIAELQGRNQETDEQARARLQTHARTALEANPTLVLWQAEAPDLYDEAVSFDALVRKDPGLAKLYPTFEKRFNAVVKMVIDAHDGEELPLPQPVKAGAEPPKKDAPAGQPSAADIQTRAKAALAKARDETTVRTLSDIPGGEGEVTDMEVLERMSAVEVAAKFEGMKSSQDILNWVMAHTA